MSPMLDTMHHCFLLNEVPPNWMEVSYASNQSLSLWFSHLLVRVEFISNWMKDGHPSAYWLSGLFFPHGFMTGVLQTFARKHKKAIDFLKLKFII
jgi:dynein heavy chain